jgi:hypothetical protein
MFVLLLFENIANRCGVKISHQPHMDVNGLEQFGGGVKNKKICLAQCWHTDYN